MDTDAETPMESGATAFRQRLQIVVSILLAALTTALVYFSLWSLPALAARTRGIGVGFVLPALAILLFWVRCRFRLFYGLAEFGVGLVTAYHLFCATTGVGERDVGIILGTFGGLYLMVRGLESVGLGLRQPRLRAAWDRFFWGITNVRAAASEHH